MIIRIALDNGRVGLRDLKRVQECQNEILKMVDLHNSAADYSNPSNLETFNFWFGKVGIDCTITDLNGSWTFKTPHSARSISVSRWQSMSFPVELAREFSEYDALDYGHSAGYGGLR